MFVATRSESLVSFYPFPTKIGVGGRILIKATTLKSLLAYKCSDTGTCQLCITCIVSLRRPIGRRSFEVLSIATVFVEIWVADF